MFLIDDLLALLAKGAGAMGIGAGGAGLTGAAPSIAAMGGKTLASMGAAAPEAAMAAGTASAVPANWTMGSLLAPNASAAGSSLMSGSLGGAAKTLGGSLGNMVGGKTLGDMIAKPSWANLGKLTEGMGDKMAQNMVMQGVFGNQPTQQQQMGPGAIETKQNLSVSEPEIEDPILKRMYQNLNQPQGFQAPTMQSWGQSPYPRRMSPI